MVGDSFQFRGVNFRERFGIRCVATDFLLPTKRDRKIEIPGRDGKYDYGSENYEERLIRFDCDLISGKETLSRAEIREISALLSKKGNLYIWDEPDKFYRGEIFTAPEIFTYPKHIIRSFTIEFVCEPFAYREARNFMIKTGNNTHIDYEGTMPAPCTIRLTNTGETTINNITIVSTYRR